MDNCESGSVQADTGRYRHHKVLSGAAGTCPTGTGIEQQKNAIPPMLLEEILAAVKSQHTDSKRTWAIDFFAGYGSLREVAKTMGLNYFAVDIRDLMSVKKPAASGKESRSMPSVDSLQLVVSGIGYPRTQRVGILSDLVKVTRLKGTE